MWCYRVVRKTRPAGFVYQIREVLHEHGKPKRMRHAPRELTCHSALQLEDMLHDQVEALVLPVLFNEAGVWHEAPSVLAKVIAT